MRGVITACTIGFVTALAGTASAVSLDTEGGGCTPPKSYNSPQLVSAQVLPAENAVTWTANYSFGNSGQASVDCSGQKDGVAFNVGYGYKVSGRYGHGAAEEVIEISISGWQQDLSPNMNGTWTLTTMLACPGGDPWLTAAACSVTSQVNKLHSFMTIKGPFPVTAKLVPPEKRTQFLTQSYPVIIAAPAEGQSLAKGAPVTVELVKVPMLANQVVQLDFSRPEKGTWAGSGAFSRQTQGASITVDGNAFNATGAWKVTARYVASMSFVGTERTFTIGGGSSASVSAGHPGGAQASPPAGAPGAGGAAQAQSVRPPVQRAEPAPRVKPGPPPPVALAPQRHPVKLVSTQRQGPSALALVVENPAGNEEKPDQAVELRIGRQVIGRARLARLAAGQGQRVVLSYELPPNVQGPVEAEVWVAGQKIGTAQVTGSAGRLKVPER